MSMSGTYTRCSECDILHPESECPLCEKKEELEDKEEEVDDLQEKVAELERGVEELKKEQKEETNV